MYGVIVVFTNPLCVSLRGPIRRRPRFNLYILVPSKVLGKEGGILDALSPPGHFAFASLYDFSTRTNR